MKFCIGLEISGQYLKLAVLQSKATQQESVQHIVQRIDPLKEEQVIEKIVAGLRSIGLKPQAVTVSIPRSFATVRNLRLPSQNKDEIDQMVDLHIGRVVPYKKEDIILSYKLLGADETGYSKLVLAILDSNTLRRRLKILEKAGLRIENIALSSYGTWQWVMRYCRNMVNSKDLYLILDIDSLFTDFIICTQENLLFTRGITIGANEAGEANQPGMAKLLSEIEQSLIIFNNEELNKKPAAIFVTGASNVPEALKKAIEAKLGFPVKSVNPAFLTKPGVSDIPGDVSLTAVSQMVIEANSKMVYFMLPEMQIKKTLREKTRDLVVLGAFCIYLFSVIGSIFLGSIYHKQAYLSRMAAESQKIEKDVGGLLGQLPNIRFVKEYLAQRQEPIFLLDQLQKILPAEIYLTYLNFDDQGKVILRAQAVKLSDVFKFVGELEKFKYFTQVETKYTRTKRVKNQEVTDFELVFRVEK